MIEQFKSDLEAFIANPDTTIQSIITFINKKQRSYDRVGILDATDDVTLYKTYLKASTDDRNLSPYIDIDAEGEFVFNDRRKEYPSAPTRRKLNRRFNLLSKEELAEIHKLHNPDNNRRVSTIYQTGDLPMAKRRKRMENVRLTYTYIDHISAHYPGLEEDVNDLVDFEVTAEQLNIFFNLLMPRAKFYLNKDFKATAKIQKYVYGHVFSEANGVDVIEALIDLGVIKRLRRAVKGKTSALYALQFDPNTTSSKLGDDETRFFASVEQARRLSCMSRRKYVYTEEEIAEIEEIKLNLIKTYVKDDKSEEADEVRTVYKASKASKVNHEIADLCVEVYESGVYSKKKESEIDETTREHAFVVASYAAKAAYSYENAIKYEDVIECPVKAVIFYEKLANKRFAEVLKVVTDEQLSRYPRFEKIVLSLRAKAEAEETLQEAA